METPVGHHHEEPSLTPRTDRDQAEGVRQPVTEPRTPTPTHPP
ncbi:hypothetical protein [Kitasatospora purpeofusca]|nr:hypothetical protein [Kitasatospora purpeofusca]MCX4757254.1 hypothetical protein [Kitasatospora purpeofusca]WSR34994.1 hypothetical protein OG715_30985 [Kitasatospora purpeofusca]WSR43212.1 hypothetical protein OG196_31495 [Kitasatospora purpeofusca]